MLIYMGDGEMWCEWCAEEGDEVAYDTRFEGGESDVPGNCCQCHRPFDNELTCDGVKYVIGCISETLKGTPEEWTKPMGEHMGYYAGSPMIQVEADWARGLQWYGDLTEKQTETLTKFIEVCDKYAM